MSLGLIWNCSVILKPFTLNRALTHVLGLKPSQNPWFKSWFQDLKKLRVLISHCRKNSVRDKVIGKKWVYSDSERSTLHRQNVGHSRGRVWPQKCGMVSVVDWVISYANDWEGYSSCFGEGVEISRNWATAHSLLVFWQPVMAPLNVSFSLLTEHQDFNRCVLCPQSMSLFQRSCFPPIIIGGTFKEKVAILFYIPVAMDRRSSLPTSLPVFGITSLFHYSHSKNMLLYLVVVICLYLMTNGASPVAQWWRICLPVQEMWVQSLGWEDPLKKKMATHQYSCLGSHGQRNLMVIFFSNFKLF